MLDRLRPRLHEYIFIENNNVFNENATIVLHLHIVLTSFSYCSLRRPFSKVIVFSRFHVDGFDENDMKIYLCGRGLK